MIGVFDSGYGGLPVLRAIVGRLPQYSYLYFGDNGRAPYGNRTPEEIYQFTLEGVEYLFSQGCDLVILACNTASARALRRIQQEVLPERYPDKRVLGIVVPTIEQITDKPWRGTVGVLATEQTVCSGAYEKEIHHRLPDIKVVQQACEQLTVLIENGSSRESLELEIKKCLEALNHQIPLEKLDALLLGCTHYELVKDIIRSFVPSDVCIYEQPQLVAESLAVYLARHSEIEKKLDRGGVKKFVTSGDPDAVALYASRFFGEEVVFQKL